MDSIARQIAPNWLITYDRFHVQQLVSDAVQTIRIKYRWEAIDEENDAILKIKEFNKKNKKEIESWNIKKQIYRAFTNSNWDTKKQLLARGRYLLYKASTKWLYWMI